MSHFTVLVVGENPEAQLAPYHEFECTGRDDQYVIDVDVTEEYQKEFEEQTATAIEEGETPESAEDFVDSWYGTKVVFDESEIDRDGKHKYGYVLVKDGKIAKAIRRTNPNAKWDWYQLGGRWNGYFKLKTQKFLASNNVVFNELGFSQGEVENLLDMFENDPVKFEKVTSKYKGKSQLIRESIQKESVFRKTTHYPEHEVGEKSFMGKPAEKGYADSVLKKYIDADGMRKDAENKAREKYRKAMAIIGHLPVNRPWSEIGAEHNYSDIARELYDNQPRVAAWNAAWNADKTVRDTFGFFSSPDDFMVSEEEYVANARNNALATFALVMDGKWYEKGKMGWWGMVSNEKENWAEEFNKLFDSISDDTLVSVYDCHI